MDSNHLIGRPVRRSAARKSLFRGHGFRNTTLAATRGRWRCLFSVVMTPDLRLSRSYPAMTPVNQFTCGRSSPVFLDCFPAFPVLCCPDCFLHTVTETTSNIKPALCAAPGVGASCVFVPQSEICSHVSVPCCSTENNNSMFEEDPRLRAGLQPLNMCDTFSRLRLQSNMKVRSQFHSLVRNKNTWSPSSGGGSEHSEHLNGTFTNTRRACQ